MKRFIDPTLTGQSPIYNDDLVFMQQGYLDVLKGYYTNLREGAREGLILSGGEVTTGATFNVSSAYIFMDGEIYKANAFVGFPNPFYYIPGADVVEQRQFRDLATKDIIVTKMVSWTATKPVSGQYVTINRLGNSRGWKKYTDTGTFVNGWTENASAPIEYRKNDNGTISWRGQLVYNSGTVTNDAFIDFVSGNEDLLPGKSNTAFAYPHPGMYRVQDGALGDMASPLLAQNVGGLYLECDGIVAGDTSATNRNVRIDITYSTVDFQ